jgi:hypothetical protein
MDALQIIFGALTGRRLRHGASQHNAPRIGKRAENEPQVVSGFARSGAVSQTCRSTCGPAPAGRGRHSRAPAKIKSGHHPAAPALATVKPAGDNRVIPL